MENLALSFKNIGKFCIELFMGKVILGADLGIFGLCHRPSGTELQPKEEFFVFFSKKKIRQKSTSLEPLIGLLAFVVSKL